MDISYIPMARGFVCLAAVIDWHSRRVLAWRLSISMDTAFCTEAVEGGDRPVRQAGDLQHRPGQSARVQGIVATSTSTTCAGRTRAIELEPRTWCTAHRCLSLRPKQPGRAAPTYRSSGTVQIIGASSPAERLWVTERLIEIHAASLLVSWLPQARQEQIRRLQACCGTARTFGDAAARRTQIGRAHV